MDKKIASQMLTKLEATANDVEALVKAGKVDPREASKLVRNIDSFSDKIEIAAYGEKSFNARRAKVLMKEPDEPYMDTFENPNKVIDGDKDEPYMHDSGASFNGKSIPTYDQDNTHSMSERDEFNVRDLSEWADGTKQQPSWPGGSAGKSTKQGSTKTWAP